MSTKVGALTVEPPHTHVMMISFNADQAGVEVTATATPDACRG